jgi:uncharacterized membrane protein YeaQ/YmgE (transglycosylase-associated protein family)
MIIAIIVGIVAGFIAGQFMKGSGYGLFMDLILGIAGGVVGRFLFGLLGIYATGIIGSILFASAGAVVLLWIGNFLKSRR